MLSIYRLPNKLPDEKVIKIFRRDIFILLTKIFYFICLAIFPLLFFFLLLKIKPDVLSGEISYPLIVLIASAYYLFTWCFFFFLFIDYYLDVGIITSERIIDIKQQGFFSRIISEQKLSQIQDVTSETHGIIPTLLKYGNVFVQSAGTQQRFSFFQIPNPDQIRDLIIKLSQSKKPN